MYTIIDGEGGGSYDSDERGSPEPEHQPEGISRRRALRYIIAAAASSAVLSTTGTSLVWWKESLSDNSEDSRVVHLSWDVDIPDDGAGLQVFSPQSTVRKTGRIPDVLKEQVVSAWRTVGVMATSRVMLAEQRQATQGARDALAFRLGNQLKIGIIPDQPDFMEQATPVTESNATIGMLVGPDTLEASIGLYVPAQKRFIVPSAGVSNLGVTTLSQLSTDFPGVRYSA